MAREFSFFFGSFGQKLVRGRVLAAALTVVVLALATAADAQTITRDNAKIRTSWTNFGVCPDQVVCAGFNRVAAGTTGSPISGTLAKPTDLSPPFPNRAYALVVIVAAEYSTATTTFQPTVTYGGNTVTRWTSTDTSSQQKTWIGWVSDSLIGSASGNPPTLSVTLTTTTNLDASVVYAGYFIGVDQNTVTQLVGSSANATDTASASILYGSDVASAANGLVLYAANADSSPDPVTQPSTPVNVPFYHGEIWAQEGGGQGDFTVGAGSVETPTANAPGDNETVGIGASERWAISVVSLAPAGSGGVHFANARMCVSPCTNILWGGGSARDFMADGGGPLEDFTSSTTVSQEVEISSGGLTTTRTSSNCNPGCPYPLLCTPGVNCLCETGEGSCGPEASAMYSYYYDSTDDMAYLFGRMRVNKQPTNGSGAGGLGSGFLASHWNLLVSFDNDPFKEFWVDANGNCNTGSSYDCVNIYYWNGNNGNPTVNENEPTFPTNQIDNTCDVPGRVASKSTNCTENATGVIRNRVNRFLGCTDDSQTNGPGGPGDCAANSISRAIFVKDTIATADWYVEVQVPMAALTTYNGENPTGPAGTNIGEAVGTQTPPHYTWDPSRTEITTNCFGGLTTEACQFFPLIQTLPPGTIQGPPFMGSGPFSYTPNSSGTASGVKQSIPGYLKLNYATCQSATDPLQKDFLFPGNNPSDNTPVTLSRFSSAPSTTGYRVEWTTVNEVANAGFDLLAKVPLGWVKVNDRPIAARATDPLTPQDYTIDVPFRAVTEFKLVDIDVNEREVEHGSFRAGEEFGGRRQVRVPDWQAISSESGAKASKRRGAAREKASEMSRAESAAPSKMTALGVTDYPELRLRVRNDGLYRVTYEAMAAAGVDLAGVPASHLSLESRAGSVPLRVEAGKGQTFGPGGFVEFYGEAVRSLYTETNVYRLAVDPKGGGRVLRDPATAGKETPAAYYLEKAEVHRNRQWTPVSPISDPWTDERIVAVSVPTQRTYAVELDNLVPGGTGASVSVGLWAETQKNYVQVFLNGENQVAESAHRGLVDATISAPVSTGLLVSGSNSLTLRLPMVHGNRFEIENLDRYSITYPRAFLARNGRLEFTAAGGAFKVRRLPSPSVVVYRVTPKKVELLTGASVSGSAGAYEVTFRGSAETARYVVSTESALLSPELSPAPETNDPTVGAAEYVVVSHPDFISRPGFDSPLDELVTAKQNQGLSVKVVDVTDVYEKFSFGVFDPAAIKTFVTQAAGTGTEYVLLVGGDTFDYLGYMTPRSTSFIPTIYTRSSQVVGFAPADGLYADLNGDLVADLAIGRLPVRSSAELAAAIEKTLAYAPSSRTAVFAADEKSGGDNYAKICDQASETLGSDWNVTKAYVDELGVAGAKAKLIGSINAGTALTTFVGHSDVAFWSFRQLFNTLDVPALANGDEPTIVAQWGCWNTFSGHPTVVSLGDTFLVTPGRGAAAVIGPSALSTSESDAFISKAFSVELAKGGTLGKALTAAKARVNVEHPDAVDVLRATNLMGDPALVLP